MLDERLSARRKAIYGGVAQLGEHDRIARKAGRLLARMIRWRDNFVGHAFSSEQRYQLPASDLEQRLRESEKKKRQLQRRINQLLSQG
jgi:hypothetical protein